MNDGELDWMRMSKRNESSNESMTDAALSAVLRVSDRLPRLLGATEDSVDDSWKELPVRAEVPRQMPGARAFDTTYELGDKLGNGKFSSVYKGRRKSDKKAVAVKVIALEDDAEDVLEELEVMRALNHVNVVRVFDAFWAQLDRHNLELRLVQELCSGGELFDWIRARRAGLRPDEQKRLVFELLSGLEYLHANGIIHRDIKPANLLLSDKSDNARLRIADFGLCRRLTAGSSTSKRQRRLRSVTRSLVGTPVWMAPEVVVCAHDRATGYSFPSDVWSAGCVIFAVVTGNEGGPFQLDAHRDSMRQVFEDILSGQLPQADALSEPAAREFFKSLLSFKPDHRSTAADALRHPWLATTRRLPDLSPEPKRTSLRRGSERSPSLAATGVPSTSPGTSPNNRRLSAHAPAHASPLPLGSRHRSPASPVPPFKSQLPPVSPMRSPQHPATPPSAVEPRTTYSRITGSRRPDACSLSVRPQRPGERDVLTLCSGVTGPPPPRPSAHPAVQSHATGAPALGGFGLSMGRASGELGAASLLSSQGPAGRPQQLALPRVQQRPLRQASRERMPAASGVSGMSGVGVSGVPRRPLAMFASFAPVC
mmetsp:Transcript_61075/g.167533  ORF Transcript_61075/g.167533 Transcript_61075/m.167533 type:complete len:596 (-) Transcript_61075:620-2407(-)